MSSEMSKVLRICTVVAVATCAAVLGTSVSQAQQYVQMSGEYHESSGRIVNIPQNPPKVRCGSGPNMTAPPTGNDARCIGARLGGPAGTVQYAKPQTGVPVKDNGTILGGLGVGDTLTFRPLVFSQMLGQQVGPVIGGAVIQLDTTFTAALPNYERTLNPPAITRVMQAQGPVPLSGQTGRPTGPTVVHTDATAMDSIVLTYKEGPNKFGGTMAGLLANTGRLYIKNAAIDNFFPPTFRPVIATQPVGDPNNTIVTGSRNGMGWDYTVLGSQEPGKVFGPASISTPCTPIGFPPTPEGCNLVTGLTSAVTLDTGNFFPAASSTKHVFAWTTGTVSAARVGFRQGQTVTETLTGMGYDTVTTGGARNVGLVAGSYSIRTSGAGAGASIELNPQMIGMDLVFTPEPGATAALLAGIGVLGWAARRRS